MDIRHYATWWELIADNHGDRTAVVHGDLHRSWRAFDDRAARLGSALTGAGLAPGSKVALYLYNGPEYLEANYATLKQRGIAVNVNYRYLDDELAYLVTDSEAEALVYHRSLGDRVGRVVDRLPGLRLLVEVDDGAGSDVDGARRYEDLIAEHEPASRIERPTTDKVMLYTGGTTGMPKGVVTEIGAQVEGLMASTLALVGQPMPTTPEEVLATIERVEATSSAVVSIPAAPLMHGTGFWLGGLIPHLSAGTIVTLTSRSLDSDELWRAVEREGVTMSAIVGDAFARPMLRALDAARDGGTPYDTSSFTRLISSGAMLSAESRSRLLDHIPHLLIIDVLGSTETAIGVQLIMRGMAPETGVFTPLPATKVLDPTSGAPVEPGSGQAGLIAVAQPITQGYYKDEDKTASLLRSYDGVTYAVTGDMATVEANGSIRLLGRGSQVINTGGEKVYPEEVEEAVKRVEGVDDCLVVGVPDDRFGERVVAVVSSSDDALEAATIIAAVREDLAAFKAPKEVVFVPVVPRAPNGKADYRGAKALAAPAAS
jgi:3-oxocholest-4-en-26-oate---CoA ligase